ncbi:hypothetical protein GCM10028796_45100 [Ramlibacter monticola]|uniref:Big-1 domain-containing protein n=1 Tax=Ramlibacter monticola TaxID=1926872 RepID=A0A937CVI7_9BURK|nr:Ig-like domain-containing protein [Ramlibacter monticola]MBL0393107.1 hypothetical protein [Ramlibacter monticola]
MNKKMKALASMVMVGALAACGGGGGSPGTTPGTGSGGSGSSGGGSGDSPSTPVDSASLALSLVNSSGAPVAGNAVSAGATVFAKALVKDASGALVQNKLVTFSAGQGSSVAFQPASGQVLTDANGIATVQVTPASATSAGAATLTATATVGGAAVSSSLDVQTSPANVSLAQMAAAQSSLTPFQNTTVTVNALVNGTAATSTPVAVGFTASCGTFSPATATTDSTGKASATFQAAGCLGGTATLTASAPGASPVQTQVTVQSPQATNVLFESATPSVIFTSAASSGDKQSTVRFKVVDAAGSGIGASTNVQVSLSAAAIASGVVFADTKTTAPKTVPTDANGEVSVIVKSGGFPTPLSVTAALASDTSVSASSSGLTVNSGRAVQKFFSPSASVFNMEGWDFDGEITNLNVRTADRLGQPVPEGTPVSFISEGGQVTASCTLTIDGNGKSGCSVQFASQAFRPTDGRVSILAFMDGDEDFVDINGNNRFDAGEQFTDMGQPFLDSDEDGAPAATEQRVGNSSVAGSGIGTNACSTGVIENVPNTCDGVWGPTRVRARLTIVFSGSFAITATEDSSVFGTPSATGVTVNLFDLHGNPLPFGTSVTATVSGGTNCVVREVIPATVPSTTTATSHRVIVAKGSSPGDTCSGAELSMKSSTPKGNVTLLGSVIIP